MSLIKAEQLIKTYKKQHIETKAIRGLDLEVKQQDFISIVGPSGSGKSTLLYILSGIESFDSGDVFLFDQSISTYTEKEKADLRSKKIGFIFQFYNLIETLTVYENVKLAAMIGLDKSRDEILDILDIVGMKAFETYYPNQLSGGQQQKVAIARCLINDPEVIFADEPTGNLDHENGLKIIEIFNQLNKVYQKTIVMVTHNLDTTIYSNRIIHMLDGRVMRDEKKSK